MYYQRRSKFKVSEGARERKEKRDEKVDETCTEASLGSRCRKTRKWKLRKRIQPTGRSRRGRTVRRRRRSGWRKRMEEV